jgi:hypothetical protein
MLSHSKSKIIAQLAEKVDEVKIDDFNSARLLIDARRVF